MTIASLEVCGGLPNIGPCVNKLCPTGYKCNLKENQCCEDKSATGALSAADKHFEQPLLWKYLFKKGGTGKKS
uniref:Granulins domain-containing protein n=1 Tax=Romanomermis culicivorax TaxID=13658 RepID=A0A915HPB0_ROMCU